MNLNELTGVIKKSYLWLAVAALVVGLSLVAYIYFDNPSGDQGFGALAKPEFKSVLSDTVSLETSTRKFQTDLPKLATVYSFAAELSAEDLAKKLKIETVPVRKGQEVFWSTAGKELAVDSSRRRFKFKSENPVGAKKFTEAAAIGKVNSYLKELSLTGPETKLAVLSTKYLDTSVAHLEEVAATQNFNLWVFQIGATVGTIPVIQENGSKVLYSVWMRVDGEIYRLEGPLRSLKFDEKTTYPVKHLSQLKKDLAKNNAVVVNLAAPLNISKDSKANLVFTQGELVYYLSVDDQQYLQPVFLVGNKDFYSRGQVEGLLTALKDQVYK